MNPPSAELDFPALEHRALALWERERVFEQLRERNRGHERFSFVDGPITANNPRGIGVHHAWGRTYKDVFQRYKAMRGFDQRYQNGFDCQGLWVEVEVEKDLGLNAKADILHYGLERFVEQCKRRVSTSAKAIVATSRRLGQWMDWEHSYYTHTDRNIEHIWHFLKRCHVNGRLYQGHRVMPWCVRCGTSLSQHELADAYEEVTHRAVYVRFPLTDRPDESLLVWTTTPWTLTANVALAVHPELRYVKVSDGGRALYMTEEAHCRLAPDALVLDTVPGSRLTGLAYRGPFDELPAQRGVEHRVVPWEEVSAEEGTGVVHIAPGCGDDDYRLGTEHGLTPLSPLDENGRYVRGFGLFEGTAVTEVTPAVVESLKRAGLLYREEDYTHRYPRCWRCKQELVFRLVDEWFIACDEIRPKLLDAARRVTWIPEHGGRLMEDWLHNMGDWCISRKRYWGLPLPFYLTSGGELTVVGSRAELRRLACDPDKVDQLPELHRPWIDAVEVRAAIGDVARRVPDVGDCWLDAGIVPFSTLGYLDEDKSRWQRWFPADFVVEMREQVRLWFYSTLFMSVTLEGRAPYRTVMLYEKMHDEHGKPMHKSLGNAIWFDDAVERMGAEPMRWLFASQNLSLNINFGYQPAAEVKRRFLTLWNTYRFYCQYAALDGFVPGGDPMACRLTPLDKWLLSRTRELAGDVTRHLEQYRLPPVVRVFETFFDDLSNWYVRLSRGRFWRSANDADKTAAYETLHYALATVSKLLAPLLPFLAEELYQQLVRSSAPSAPVSVHLCPYPEPAPGRVDRELMSDMALVRAVVRTGRKLRASAGIKVRQPLGGVTIILPRGRHAALRRLRELVCRELNVKAVHVAADDAGLYDRRVAPKFRALGRAYGPQVPRIAAAIEAMPPADALRAVDKGEPLELRLDDTTLRLDPQYLEVKRQAKPDLAVESEGEMTVALHTAISPSLRHEGYARDFVHAVQNLRRDMGLAIADRVALRVRGPDDILAALDKHDAYIRRETLAVSVARDGGGEGRRIVVDGRGVYVSVGKTA